MDDDVERERLEARLDASNKVALARNADSRAASSGIAKEKTQYFEKIALGSGATIAAIVSFIGAHPSKLQPSWLLRSTLVVWVVVMAGAMFRNWRYPFYVLASYGRPEYEAKQKRERCKRDLIAAYPIDNESGQPIDREEWIRHFEANDKLYQETVDRFAHDEETIFEMVRRVEAATLVLALIGMLLLIFLAWRNF